MGQVLQSADGEAVTVRNYQMQLVQLAVKRNVREAPWKIFIDEICVFSYV